MSSDRLLELLSLAVLACVAVTGLARGLALAAAGVWVLPVDRERTPGEVLADVGFVLGGLAWLYEALVTAVAPDWCATPESLRGARAAWPAVRWAGLAAALGGAALYVRALRDAGASWRFSIDRERAGELVTSGVFAFTRNPIYLALALVALGVSLALADLGLAVLAGAAPLYFHHLVRREERFLAAHYPGAYASYRARVPRWLPRPRRRERGGGGRE